MELLKTLAAKVAGMEWSSVPMGNDRKVFMNRGESNC